MARSGRIYRSDGTVIWTLPDAHTYVTTPRSALLFPALHAPTGDVPPSRCGNAHDIAQVAVDADTQGAPPDLDDPPALLTQACGAFAPGNGVIKTAPQRDVP